MNIPDILARRFEDAKWVLTGSDYSGLNWLSDTPKPTEEELSALWDDVQAEIAAEAQAKEDRKASVIEKLGALGLTPDEVADVFGLEVQ